MTKLGFWCAFFTCLILNAVCACDDTVTPESKPVMNSADLPTTVLWKEWSSEQRGYFARTTLRAMRHGDREVIQQLIQSRLALVPDIITHYIVFSDVVRRYGEVGWDMELYSANDYLEAAELVGSVYAELTGDSHPKNQVVNLKLQVRAIALGQKGYELLDNDAQGALVKLMEAYDIFHTIGAKVEEAKTLLNIGVAYIRLEDYGKPIAYIEQGYGIAVAEKEYGLAADMALNLALLCSAQKLDDKAKEAARHAIEMAEKSGDAEKAKSVRKYMEPLLGK